MCWGGRSELVELQLVLEKAGGFFEEAMRDVGSIEDELRAREQVAAADPTSQSALNTPLLDGGGGDDEPGGEAGLSHGAKQVCAHHPPLGSCLSRRSWGLPT